MKPPFPYFGAKVRMAPRIASILPPHKHYVEPFAGSLSVLLSKEPSDFETVNDIDGDITTFWRVLRDQPESLETLCALTPHSLIEFRGCKDRPGSLGDLEVARRVWVRLTQGFTGTLRDTTGWRRETSTSYSPRIHPMRRRMLGRFGPAADRLMGVTLESRDALDVIRDYGGSEDACIYADPPYLAENRTSKNYASEMDDECSHAELADALKSCRASVVLSGYHSRLYDRLYRGWDAIDVSSNTTQGDVAKNTTEVLWVKHTKASTGWGRDGFF